MKTRYNDIRSRTVFTFHSRENIYTRRPEIPLHKVFSAIANAKIKHFAGHNRYKVKYKGVTVIYKMDYKNPNKPLYVVITYYKSPRHYRKDTSKKVLTY